MMKFKCFVILGLFVHVQSASIYSKPIDIPVEVVYSEEVPYESHYIAPRPNSVNRRNLDEKIQLSSTELRQVSQIEDNNHYGNINSLKNLDYKVQLSQEDLLQVDKHLPLIDSQEVPNDFKVNSVEEAAAENQESQANLEENKPVNSEKPTETSQPTEEAYESLGEASSTVQSTSVSSTTEEDLPDPNIILLIQLAQNIVSNGLISIRENIETLAAAENPDTNPPVSPQQWDRLNRTVSNFFSSLLERGNVKGNREAALKVIESGFRRVTDNFVESLRDEASGAAQAPQKPGVGQNIINLVSTGFQGLSSSLNNIRNRSTTASTVSGEKQSTTPAPGPFQNLVNQFGQLGETINQLNPFTSTAAPGSQGDEGSTPPNPFQNFANQVGQVISGLNPLNQGSTAAPGGQNEGSTPGGPLQAVQSVFSQVGQAVNNIFNQGSTPAPGAQNEGSTAGPFQQAFQNVVNAIGNLNPLNPSSTAAPGAQNEESTSGPLQGLINQVGQAFNGLNPLNQGSTASPGNNPLQGVQNAINQAGQAVGSLNPFNQGSTAAPANPLEGIQNAVSQVGQALSTLAPPRQGEAAAPAAPAEQQQSSQVSDPPKASDPEEKVRDPSEQEIMVAID